MDTGNSAYCSRVTSPWAEFADMSVDASLDPVLPRELVDMIAWEIDKGEDVASFRVASKTYAEIGRPRLLRFLHVTLASDEAEGTFGKEVSVAKRPDFHRYRLTHPDWLEIDISSGDLPRRSAMSDYASRRIGR